MNEKIKNKKKIIIIIVIVILLIIVAVSVSLLFLHKNKPDNTENKNNVQESIDTEPPSLVLKENVEITDGEEITTDLFVESCFDNESEECIVKFLDNDNEVDNLTLESGEYEITIIAYDESDNKTKAKTKLTIIDSKSETQEESNTNIENENNNSTTENKNNTSSNTQKPSTNNGTTTKPSTGSNTGSSNNSGNNNNNTGNNGGNIGNTGTTTPEQPPVVEQPKVCNKTNSRPERIVYREIPCGTTNTQQYVNQLNSERSDILFSNSIVQDNNTCRAFYGDDFCYNQVSVGVVYNTDYEAIGLYIEYSVYHSETNGGQGTLVARGYLRPDNSIAFSWKNY